MKMKLISIALCFAALAFTLFGCGKGNEGEGGEKTESCSHSYAEGVCSQCGEADPNYKPEKGDEEGGEQGGEEGGEQDERPATPPIDFGGETELPFVPAE